MKSDLKLNDPKTRQTLLQLKQELEKTKTSDETEKTTIEHLIGDIQELIDHIDDEAPLVRQTHQRLLERLRKSIALFEVSHPALVAFIEKTLEILDTSGI
jgi:hypothetical protein